MCDLSDKDFKPPAVPLSSPVGGRRALVLEPSSLAGVEYPGPFAAF